MFKLKWSLTNIVNNQKILQIEDHTIMKATTILLISVLFMMHSDCCDSYYKFQNSKCTFYMDYLDSTCTDFHFRKCSWRQCTNISYTSQYTYCLAYETVTNDVWKTCTSQCCDPSVLYQQTSSGIQQCQSYLYQQDDELSVGVKVAIIMTLIIVFVGPPILIYACCYKSDNRDGFTQFLFKIITCHCLRTRNTVNSSPEIQQNKNTNLQMNVHIVSNESNFIQLKSKWKTDNTAKTKLQDEVCSVCLDTTPTLMLQCGHVYHDKCIVAWLRRKKQCVLCRSKQLNLTNLYCKKCLQRYYQLSFLVLLEDNVAKTESCKECHLVI